VIFRIFLIAVMSVGALQAQSASPSDRRFVGAWRLVSWQQVMADGTTRPSPTADTGYLIYSDTNRMCAVMMHSKRQKWSGPPATLQDAAARSSNVVSYCARVEVHSAEGFVLHYVDMEFNPGIIGTVRKRWFTFAGPDRLRLRIDPAEFAAPIKENELVWERVTERK
jgi:hypothetical protein